MYFAIERQPTGKIHTTANKHIVAPCFFTAKLATGEEFVPVFLSKLHGYVFIQQQNNTNDFHLVRSENICIDVYREICKEEILRKKTMIPWPCMIVTALQKQEEKHALVLYEKKLLMQEIFFEEENIKKKLHIELNDMYLNALNHESLTDEQLIVLANKAMRTENKNIRKSPLLKIAEKISHVLPKKQQKTESQKETEEKEVGAMHVFLLKQKDGSLFATEEDGKTYIY